MTPDEQVLVSLVIMGVSWQFGLWIFHEVIDMIWEPKK